MRRVELGKTGEKISVIGQGTWGIASLKSKEFYDQWKKSLHKGIELGMDHIDTAEVYGMGKSERIVGEVIAEYKRDALFITSKLFPLHVTRGRMKKAACSSLKRLGIDCFDLYLIHQPNPLIPLTVQMRAMEELVNEGKTRYIGVSNFSVGRFINAQNALKKTELVNNQLLVNITRQKHIHESLPYYQKEGITMTAYSPLGHRGFESLPKEVQENLEHIAASHKASVQQIAIAWLTNMDRVITIPKAFHVHHTEANAAAAKIQLTQDEMRRITQPP